VGAPWGVPQLVLGPILRAVEAERAVIWCEVDGPCTVEVLGATTPSFGVAGHHYALVEVAGLEPGVETPYEVRLDGAVAWPPPASGSGMSTPPPTIRPWRDGDPVRVLAGSCRQTTAHDPHRAEQGDDRPGAIGPDALHTWARRMALGDAPRPDLLLLVGDQVYADEQSDETAQALDRRRGGPPPDGRPQITGFEEYTWLYQEAWSEPWVRWLFACVPVGMVFDDHDIVDDWNTSSTWRREIAHEPWWRGRIEGGLTAYWLYQQVGAAPGDAQDEELLAAVRAADDGGPVLTAMARRADDRRPGDDRHRFSYVRDVGPVHVVVVDSRNARVVGEGARSMLDERSWAWVERAVAADARHLLVVTSLPWLLPRAIHDLEEWDAAVAAGAWGRLAARVGERIRQAFDLEHWAAFGTSATRLGTLLRERAGAEGSAPPATVVALSGDVHFAYVAEADLGGGPRVRQVVTSPIRQAIPGIERAVQRGLGVPPLSWLARALVRATRGRPPGFPWRVTDGPWFDNNVALLTYDGPRASVAIHAARHGDDGVPVLHPLVERAL
jgi:hypothetical protein